MESRTEVIKTVYVEQQLFTADHKRNIHAIRLSSFVKGGIYQAITSLSAFEVRLLNRWYDSYRKKHKNSNPRYGQTSLTLEGVKRDDVVEVVHHKSLQDFYNYIHYDPQRGKSKKYLDAFMGVWKHAD